MKSVYARRSACHPESPKQLSLFTITLILLFIWNSEQYPQWFLQYSGPGGYFQEIEFSSADTGWVAGTWMMLRTTTGGTIWDTLISRPQGNTQIFGISFADNNTGWYLEYVGDEGECRIYKTTNAGSVWVLQSSFPDLIWDIQFLNQNRGYAVGMNPFFPKFWKTTNGGASWTSVLIDAVHGWDVQKVFFLNESYGWAAGDAVYRTTDGGNSWTLLQDYLFSIDRIQFTTPLTGWYCDLLGLEKTNDGGATWTRQLNMGDGWHNSTLHFIDSDTGYFAPFYALLKTTNGGSSWSYQMWDFTLNLSSIFFLNADYGWAVSYFPGRIFKTTNGGLPVELSSFSYFLNGQYVVLNWSTASEINNRGFYVERKEKESWKTLDFVSGSGTTSEIHNYEFTDDISDAAGEGSIFYRLRQTDYDGSYKYSAEIEVKTSITEFTLEQNYPNPFNPATTIQFTVPLQGKVQLIIYDALGNEVKRLIDEEKSPGSYNLEFNADGLAGGVYFYRLCTGGRAMTRKMILLK